jgi:hypothetical protein
MKRTRRSWLPKSCCNTLAYRNCLEKGNNPFRGQTITKMQRCSLMFPTAFSYVRVEKREIPK